MIRNTTFGKLGKRAVPRLVIEIDGGIQTPGFSEQCRVENVSRTGCRLQLAHEPRPGSTVMIRIERIEALGEISWVRDGRCGVNFAETLEPKELERLLWIINNAESHEKNMAKSAAANWR